MSFEEQEVEEQPQEEAPQEPVEAPQEDVNEVSEPSSETTQANPSAETQNTEQPVSGSEEFDPEVIKEQQPGFYNRFKERHEIAKQFEALQKSGDWEGYNRLKAAADHNPKFAKDLLALTQKHFAPEQVQETPPPPEDDPLNEYPDELTSHIRNNQTQTQELQQEVANLKNQNAISTANAVYGNYEDRFNTLASEAKLSDYGKQDVHERVKNKMDYIAREGRNVLGAYDEKLLNQIFQEESQSYQTLERKIRGSYQVDKQQDITPASTSATGATGGHVVKRPQTPKERTARALEMVRNSE